MSFQLPYGGRRSSDLVYQNKHHGDPVFNNNFFERLYMWNDECDGLIWKKEHNEDAILTIASWYPGSYASTSYTSGMVRPADSHKEGKKAYSYVTNGGFIGGQGLKRTKDFIIAATQLYFYKYYVDYRVSNDGVHWRPWVGGIPAQWGGGTANGSFSIKENVGITYGAHPNGTNAIWRIEINEHGDINLVNIGVPGQGGVEALGSCIGDIGTQGIHEDGIHQWYKFINANGDRYVSALPNRYQYTDDRETDPTKKVKWATYNWSFRYLNGKYYAATMKGGSIYWNPVKQEWQQLRSFIIVESEDGFKHVTPHYVMDPCPLIYYQNWDYFYFNNKLIIMEWGKEHEEDQSQYLKIRDINNNVLGSVINKVRMPFIGRSRDGSFDALDFYFHGATSETNRVCNRSYGGGLGNAVYIKDGKPAEPYGSIMIPTAFRQNGWSSSSYDVGGFIFIRGKENDPFFTSQPDEAFAFCSDNSMCDRDNATWGEDYYRCRFIKSQGDPLEIDHIEENMSFYKNVYHNIEVGIDELSSHYYMFHLGRIVTPYKKENGSIVAMNSKRRTLRNLQTVFDFRNRSFNESSEYYFPYTGEFTSYGGRSFSKVEAGKSYCFAVWYWYNGSYLGMVPLCISNDEFTTIHDVVGAGGQNNSVQTIEYGNMLWYYCGFGYGLYSNYPDAERYIDLSPLGVLTNEKVVLECLKVAHPL